ncbi:MAG: dihydropteroate synthase [Bdellovibrio sp.]|nr:dihydropteroate synthase [Bdellovibrio sp.]
MSADFVVLGLGSNLDHPLKNLRQALAAIKKIKNIEVKNVSPIYESDAQVPGDAPIGWNKRFLNAAVLIAVPSKTNPYELLTQLKTIEKQMGRNAAEVWAPRLIDIDILYWHDITLAKDDLNLPHARVSERPFALLPLVDVFPNAAVDRPIWSYEWVQEKPFATKKSLTEFWPEFLGILNLTDDSFSDGGHFKNETNLIEQIHNLVESGATILDFGAESTRPGAQVVTADQEFESLKTALKIVQQLNLNKKIQISIDSYKPEVIEKCLTQFHIDFINDVTGLKNPHMISLVKESQKKAFVMHSLSVPAKRDEFISEQIKPTDFLKAWWSQKRQSLLQAGLSESQLIFDPGIGFGKTNEQNLFILNHLEDFGVDDAITDSILIGHSRKSYQTLFSSRPASERDLETALITQKLNLAFTQYLRVHDVKSQALALRTNI